MYLRTPLPQQRLQTVQVGGYHGHSAQGLIRGLHNGLVTRRQQGNLSHHQQDDVLPLLMRPETRHGIKAMLDADDVVLAALECRHWLGPAGIHAAPLLWRANQLNPCYAIGCIPRIPAHDMTSPHDDQSRCPFVQSKFRDALLWSKGVDGGEAGKGAVGIGEKGLKSQARRNCGT